MSGHKVNMLLQCVGMVIVRKSMGNLVSREKCRSIRECKILCLQVTLVMWTAVCFQLGQ